MGMLVPGAPMLLQIALEFQPEYDSVWAVDTTGKCLEETWKARQNGG